MITPTTIAKKANVSIRTVQRRIRVFNKRGNTSFASSAKVKISDEDLINYLSSEFNLLDIDPKKKAANGYPITPQGNFRVISGNGVKSKKKVKKKTSLQTRLSADWLVISVLVVILFADMFAFGAIGDNEFGDKIKFAAVPFSIIGLATGIGSVVTYNRIENANTAETWKYIFGLLQFIVFSLTVNEKWFFAELTMTLMFVLVFIGVQRSIKK